MCFKNIFLFLSFCLLTLNLQAREGFYCIPSMRSTWIAAEKKDGFVYISVRNPMGYDYMPQVDGPISKATLPFQKMQFDDLQQLGDEFNFKWKAEKCNFQLENKTVVCSGSAEEKRNDIEALSLTTIEITEKYPDATYLKNRYRFSFEKEGNTYFASLDFFNSTCENLKPGQQHFPQGKK